MTEITHHITDEDMIEMESADIDDLNYEFEDELKEIFGER